MTTAYGWTVGRHWYSAAGLGLGMIFVVALLRPIHAAPSELQNVPESVLSAGSEHTCGLKPDGSVHCWGANSSGQAQDQAGPFSQVSAGDAHTCGLRLDGSVDCWGSSAWVEDQPGPFTQVSVGYYFACGLKSNGTADCWGYKADGQDQAGPFTQLSSGLNYTCGVGPNGGAKCWGWYPGGISGDQPGPFTQVSTGWWHACGLKTDGSADCWGSNKDSSGNYIGQAEDRAGPFTQVTAGGFHTCGLKPNGSVECWGLNDNGQATAQDGPFLEISAGYRHVCGLKLDASVDCWGNNLYGQAEDQAGPFGPYGGFNTPPVANDVSVTTAVNTPVGIVLSATDADNDPLTYYVGGWPQHGTLQGTPPNLTYTPATDFYGQDSLRYLANDGKANSNEATVNITVKTPSPPSVFNVRRQFGRYFLKGKNHQVLIEVTAHWPQGNHPQSIAIKRPDGNQLALIPGQDIHPGSDGVSVNVIAVNMAGCSLGACPITVVPVGSVSTGQQRTYDFFYIVEMPAALSANNLRVISWTPKGPGWINQQDYGYFSSQMLNIIPELADAEPIMRNALDFADDTHPFRIPSWVPIIGGDYGVDLSTLRVSDSATFTTLDASLQTVTSGHLDYRFGNMAGPISLDLAGQSNYVRDGTFLRFNTNRLDFTGRGHRLGADFTLPGIIRLSVDRPYTGHIWAVYRQNEQHPTSGSIYAMGGGINSAIESSGSVEALVAKAKVTIGGGVGVSRSFDVPTLIDIRKADASVYARVNWRVLFWSKSWGKTWSCSIIYSTDPPTVSCAESRTIYDLIEWHRASRVMADGPYAELTANEPDMLRWTSADSHSTSELKLLDNIYADAEPQMAIDPSSGELMVVFTHDNLATDIATAYDIAYMRRTDAGWSAPVPVAANQQADVKPDVAFANGQAVAVWSTLDLPTADGLDEPEDAFPHMEIAAAVFDPSTSKWSTPYLLTDNMFFDFEPVVAGDGNKAMAVWYADLDNDVAIGPEVSEEHDMSKQLYYAIWDGSSWSAPVVFVRDMDLVGKPSLALHGGKGVLAYAVDTDGSATSISDREIMLVSWNGTKWLPPQQFTDDDLEDRLPAVAYFNNQPWVAWLQVNTQGGDRSQFAIVSTPLDGQSTTVVQPIAVIGQVEELKFADNGGVQPVLLWREFGQMASAVNYAVYDPQHGRWSAPNALTDDDAYNSDYSALINADGHIISTYVKTDLSIEESLVEDPSGNPVLIGIPTDGRSAIYFLDHAIAADLAVYADDITLTNAQPVLGESVDVEATIHNLGDLSHRDIGVRFVEVTGGKIVGNMVIDELPAGQTTTVHSTWKIPALAQMPLRLALEVDPDNLVAERDETNNRAEVAVGLPDLAVTFVQAEETADRQLILRAVVENLGRSSSTSQVAVDFYYNDQLVLNDAAHIGTVSIDVPAPGDSVAVEYLWAAPNIAAGDYQVFVVADSTTVVDDSQRLNNQLYTVFRRSPGAQPDVLAVSVSPTTSRVSTAVGTTAVHRLIVKNEGNVSDRFDLALLASEWTVNAPAQIGPLDPGQSTGVSILVKVPTNALETSEATYLIRSRTDGTKSAPVTLITEVGAKIYLPIVR